MAPEQQKGTRTRKESRLQKGRKLLHKKRGRKEHKNKLSLPLPFAWYQS